MGLLRSRCLNPLSVDYAASPELPASVPGSLRCSLSRFGSTTLAESRAFSLRRPIAVEDQYPASELNARRCTWRGVGWRPGRFQLRQVTREQPAMPRFYFHVHHKRSHYDLEGTELRDHRAAWVEATTSCGEMMKDLDGQLEVGPECGWKSRMKIRMFFSFFASAPRWVPAFIRSELFAGPSNSSL
jgi:hypothetical protein